MNKSRTNYLAFFIALLSGLIFTTFHITGYGLEYFPGDLGDARFNMYLLEHAYLFFSGAVNSYWNAPFLYPETEVITYSDNLLGTAPFYALFRILGFDCETSFQLWYIFLMILNYTACYLFLNFIFKNPYSAAMGAYIFAFSLSLYGQSVHAQTFPRMAIPMVFWMGILYIRTLDPKYFFLLLLFEVYQFYCGIYLGMMLLIPTALLVLVSGYNYKMYLQKMKEIKWWGFMIGSVLINFILIACLMYWYLKRAETSVPYPFQYVFHQLPTIKSYFYTYPGTLFWQSLDQLCSHYDNFWDFWLFSGVIATIATFTTLLILCVKFFLNDGRVGNTYQRVNMIFLFVNLITFMFFLRIYKFSLYEYVFMLPGFNSMRALQRIINIELLFYAISVAYLFNILLKNRRWKTLLFILFMTLMVLDNYVQQPYLTFTDKSQAQERINKIVRQVKTVDPNSILSYEPDSVSNSNFTQLDGMLASQRLGIKCINGYTSTSPEIFWQYWEHPNEENRILWLKSKQKTNETVLQVK